MFSLMITALELSPNPTDLRDANDALPPKVRDSGRVIQLDFVRGLAILLVMEQHFLTVPVENFWARDFDEIGKHIGWMGVDLFFVLSGFLVGGLLIQEMITSGGIRVGRFLLRRMFKIWPAYYLYILAQVCLRKHPLKSFLWQNVFHIQNYAGTSLKHTWSLAVEEHFYIVLPIILLALYRNARLRSKVPLILGILCFLVLGGRIVSVFVLQAGDLQAQTHGRVDSLIFGVLLSYIFHMYRGKFDALLRLRWRPCLLFFMVIGFLIGAHEGPHSRFMWSIGFTLNYIALASLLLLVYGYNGRLIRTVPYRAIANVGLYSYGIYLWHVSIREPMVKLATHLPPGIQWGSLLVGQYVAAIVLGIVMTKAVEFPMLRLRDRLIPRGTALPPFIQRSLKTTA